MKDKEYEEIAPGLLKIQQVLGNVDSTTHLSHDKKKLLVDSCLHIAEILGITLAIPSGDLGDDIDAIIEQISIHSGIRIQKITLKKKMVEARPWYSSRVY